jgi:hypothetical protein
MTLPASINAQIETIKDKKGPWPRTIYVHIINPNRIYTTAIKFRSKVNVRPLALTHDRAHVDVYSQLSSASLALAGGYKIGPDQIVFDRRHAFGAGGSFSHDVCLF